MKIVFWGTPYYAAKILETILSANYEVVGIVTQPDKRRGRGKELIHSPVKKIGKKMNIPVITPNNIKGDIEKQNEINSLNGDIYIVVAFGQILPETILNHPLYGSWNIHASLLPRWRGAAPIQRSIMNGDAKTGVAIMAMEKGLDTGAILLEKEIVIKLEDNKDYIESELIKISSELIIETLKQINSVSLNNNDKISNNLSLTRQNDTNRELSYAKIICKEENRFSWKEKTIDIHRRVKGLYPNAYTYINNKRVKCLDTCPIDLEYKDQIDNSFHKYIREDNYINHQYGEVLAIIRDIGFIVKTFNSAILIIEAQLEGKNKVNGEIASKQLMINVGSVLNYD